MLRIGMLLVGGAIVTAGAGLAILSVVATGAASSLGVLVSCVPTLPPEDEEQEQTEQEKEKSETSS
ncbi:hypothetical protein HJG54_29270 [Leptolyngbya sp. NK1-12]|uniref:Uncharacterized protein n=1 Tax=Leptolyngbya sp. NK1-12 TaxID=2547451 RepID=A0AA96WQD1_9CYAN|nr:hypothetical protein [Leptolyngbya sp. NK1-12]WNZ27011.1 hypothetical protein HJG54_29270 [Leptolyngbya sp. NK1-12]